MSELVRLLTERTDFAWEQFEPLRDSLVALGEMWASNSLPELKPDGVSYLIHAQLTDIDPRLRVEAGAFVHQLRATLDNIAWGLANRVRPNPGKVSFPICEDPQQFAHWSLIQVLGRGSGAARALERLQPYSRAEGRYLIMLHNLWNQDKHRLPPFLAALPAGALLLPDAEEPPIVSIKVYGGRRGKAVRHNDVIGKVVFAAPPNRPPKVRVALHPCLDTKGPPVDRYLPQAFNQMHRYVRDEVMRAIEGYL